MNKHIEQFNTSQIKSDQEICELLMDQINESLPDAEGTIWHAHPVWFLDENPIVGYNKLKDGVRLLFWSGQSFDEAGLDTSGTFKAAGIIYTDVKEIDIKNLKRWLKKAKEIQWDYKNIVKRKGTLIRLR